MAVRRGTRRILALVAALLLALLLVAAVLHLYGARDDGAVWRAVREAQRVAFAPREPSVDPVASKRTTVGACLDGVVTAAAGGRLGNAFMEWASAMGVALALNRTAALAAGAADPLRLAFAAGVVSPSVTEFLLMSRPLRRAAGADSDLCVDRLGDSALEAAALAADADMSLAALRRHDPIVLPRYVVLPQFIAPLADGIRRMVHFRRRLQEGADATLLDIRKGMAAPADQEIVYIGVHARRTDYQEWMVRRLNATRFADQTYFKSAVQFLLRHLGQPRAALVVVSDDMPWARDVLVPYLNRNAGPRAKAFAAGGGDEDSVNSDLALLAACNHTVISYGTYAMAAALLAGGRTVAFDVGVDWYFSSGFAKHLPSWVLLR